MADPRRTAVLISGRGSNLRALIAAAPSAGTEIALVLSDREEAAGLRHAMAAGIPCRTVDRRRYADKARFEAEIDAALRGAGAELVCLAGFMRVLTPSFVERWRDRLLNVHPSLLPAFPGLRTHERALAAGARVHGCTVHLVRAAVDDGPILVQGVAPVLPGDTAETLAARVLELEHLCYPRALALLASGRLRVEDEGVVLDGEGGPGERLLLHPLLPQADAG